MNVDLVKVQTKDGLRLDGFLRSPAGSSASQLSVDILIMLHGVGGNFYGPGLFEEMADYAIDAGCAVLRVNNRGHDPVSRGPMDGQRFGAAYEMVDDCMHDWDAWISFAQDAGYRNIGLWGHSLGAVKSIYYMATEKDSRIKSMVASSPPRFSYNTYQGMDDWGKYVEQLEEAQKHISNGHPDALMEVRYPSANLLTAGVFMDKYGPGEKYDVIRLLPNVKVPTLVTLGSLEGVERGQSNSLMGFAGLGSELEKLSGELDQMAYASVLNGDHFYTGQREPAWKIVQGFLA